MSSHIAQHWVEYAFGSGIVISYAYSRFNTPVTNRSSTTAARYHTAAALYAFALVLAYLLMGGLSPQFIRFLLQGAAVPTGFENLSAPLVVAMILTMFLPRIPLLSIIDEQMRRSFQRMGYIPFEVSRLSNELESAPFELTEANEAMARQFASRTACAVTLDPRWFAIEPSPTPQFLWTKATVIMAHIEKWTATRRFQGYLNGFPEELPQVRKQYEELCKSAARLTGLIDSELTAEVSSADARAINELRQSFINQARFTLERMYALIGRGVLHCQMTHAARLAKLGEMGFDLTSPPPAATLDLLICLLLSIFMVLLTAFVALGRGSFEENLLRSIRIALIHCLAVFCAVYPREVLKMGMRRDDGNRPIAHYFFVGTTAFLFGSILSVGINALVSGSLTAAIDDFRSSFPWMFLAFASAFATAVLLDNQGRNEQRFSWREGSIQAAVMLAMSVFVWLYLRERRPLRVPPLANVLLINAFVGFIIGGLVPTWFRAAPRNRDLPRSPWPVFPSASRFGSFRSVASALRGRVRSIQRKVDLPHQHNVDRPVPTQSPQSLKPPPSDSVEVDVGREI